MKLEKLIKRPHYESILMLLEIFDKDGKGFRQQHFRYALMDNPELPKKKMKYFKDFFGKTLNRIQENTKLAKDHSTDLPGIFKGCIKSRSKLSNYLDELKKKKLVIPKGKHPDIRYHLTPKFYEMAYQSLKVDLSDKFLERVKTWQNKKLIWSYLFRKEHISNFNEIPFEYLTSSTWLLEGVPQDEKAVIFESKELLECIAIIEENLFKINNLLSPYTDKERIGFYYLGGFTSKDLDGLL